MRIYQQIRKSNLKLHLKNNVKYMLKVETVTKSS